MTEGKTALVTGASRGIGRAIALELARNGVNVAVNYAGSEAKANEVVDEIKALGREAFAVQADVSDSDSVSAMVKETVERFGRLDILINNAGIGTEGVLATMYESQIAELLRVNVEAPILLTKYLVHAQKLHIGLQIENGHCKTSTEIAIQDGLHQKTVGSSSFSLIHQKIAYSTFPDAATVVDAESGS